jgi:hypothetical protein
MLKQVQGNLLDKSSVAALFLAVFFVRSRMSLVERRVCTNRRQGRIFHKENKTLRDRNQSMLSYPGHFVNRGDGAKHWKIDPEENTWEFFSVAVAYQLYLTI